MTKDEALKLALEALERSVATCFDQYAHQQVMSQPDHFINQTITAIKEALAQPEQEPVLWNMPDGKTVDKWALQFYGGQKGKPLYTTPPQRTWVGLTRDEQSFVYSNLHNSTSRKDSFWVDFANAIEAKLKEKNT